MKRCYRKEEHLDSLPVMRETGYLYFVCTCGYVARAKLRENKEVRS